MLEALRGQVDGVLTAFLAEKRARWTAPEERALFEAAERLTLRGGKRLRAALVVAGHRAAGGQAPLEALARVGAAFELLQTYLLIQDDWMDGDLVRRGGPSIHAQLRSEHADAHLADALAILASDLAAGHAWELVSGAPFPAELLLAAVRGFAEMHEEVVVGQSLDLRGSRDTERVHRLKTAGYTVAWPLRIGARLASASAAQEAILADIGGRLGVAFQVRDDLLGTFGHSALTGKPVAADLLQAKETAVLGLARARGLLGRPELLAVLGHADAAPEAVLRAQSVLVEAGIEATLEARIADEVAVVHAAVRAACFAPEGALLLDRLVERLTARSA